MAKGPGEPRARECRAGPRLRSNRHAPLTQVAQDRRISESSLILPHQHPIQVERACRQTPASLCHQTTAPKSPPNPLAHFPT